MTEIVDFGITRISEHDCKKFSSGSAEFNSLKQFLVKDAKSFQDALIATTYVAHLNDEKQTVIGYITLTCSEVNLKDVYDLSDCERAQRYETMPSVKIARLATDARYRGKQQIGRQLVALALAAAKDMIAPLVGCRFLITDAKKSAVSFYEKLGFSLLDTEENKARNEPIMFLDLKKISDFLESKAKSGKVQESAGFMDSVLSAEKESAS